MLSLDVFLIDPRFFFDTVRFIEHIVDNLNAEISLGTVTNVDEAVTWLSYTYLYVRMKRNPFIYGMDHSEPAEDPLLGRKRHEIITMAAERLARCQMIIFDQTTGYLTPKDLGRIASNFYIKHTSIEIFNQLMRPRMTEADVLSMMALSSEFDNIKARDTEHKELKGLLDRQCACDIKVSDELPLTTLIRVHLISLTHTPFTFLGWH
jgi:replicative superfamily II helicase